uniref:Uncharacterized protein n=1 Tax=Arundo donax TaxID=35708 RepID=A0A0A8ZN11_ARUDO
MIARAENFHTRLNENDPQTLGY